MTTDTPETDAALAQYAHHLPNWLATDIMAAIGRKMERERNEAREQRDRLAVVLQNIRSGYGGQIPIPACDCGDCELLITIDNALQYITKPN